MSVYYCEKKLSGAECRKRTAKRDKEHENLKN